LPYDFSSVSGGKIKRKAFYISYVLKVPPILKFSSSISLVRRNSMTIASNAWVVAKFKASLADIG
jgi:hypothetical protein